MANWKSVIPGFGTPGIHRSAKTLALPTRWDFGESCLRCWPHESERKSICLRRCRWARRAAN